MGLIAKDPGSTGRRTQQRQAEGRTKQAASQRDSAKDDPIHAWIDGNPIVYTAFTVKGAPEQTIFLMLRRDNPRYEELKLLIETGILQT